IPGAAVMPWALAIARRLMIDSARRRRVELGLFTWSAADDDRIVSPAADAADDVLHASRLGQRMSQRVGALAATQRTAYRLVKQEGVSLKKAAHMLGTSVTAVKLRTHRACQALRAALGEEGGGAWGPSSRGGRRRRPRRGPRPARPRADARHGVMAASP